MKEEYLNGHRISTLAAANVMWVGKCPVFITLHEMTLLWMTQSWRRCGAFDSWCSRCCGTCVKYSEQWLFGCSYGDGRPGHTPPLMPLHLKGWKRVLKWTSHFYHYLCQEKVDDAISRFYDNAVNDASPDGLIATPMWCRWLFALTMLWHVRETQWTINFRMFLTVVVGQERTLALMKFLLQGWRKSD